MVIEGNGAPVTQIKIVIDDLILNIRDWSWGFTQFFGSVFINFFVYSFM